jgi:phosphoglycerol transferase MdoB-like AlkP superfamily enzyme
MDFVESVLRPRLQPWLRRFGVLIVSYLLAQSLLRLGLAFRSGREFIDGPLDLIRPFLVGFWFDLSVLLIFLVPGTLYWALLPQSLRGGRLDRALTYAGAVFVFFGFGFTLIGEVLFWNEFGTRFNFIAVDYLVYTREVVGNILESYPVGTLVTALIAVSLALTFLLRRKLQAQPDSLSYAGRLGVFAVLLIVAVGVNDVSKSSWTELSTNRYANELSGNGYYTLVRAYFHNEIDYRRFYKIADDKAVNERIRGLLASSDAQFVTKIPGDVTRDIRTAHAPLKKNVVLVTIESFSADYMEHFGNKLGLTPNLDALADQSAFFTRMLATGTRTVRGLEAVTLSVPPTPGQSILRRPDNEKLFSIGSVFRDHGYSTTFLYGGDGIFDNMNQFFGDNGYRVIDRPKLASSEITFSNAWGVCDEDLFARAVKEADLSHAKGELFFQHVMTVSNHRPFTYPQGRIVPPHSGPAALGDRTLAKYVEQTREGGVKYTDYAIGKFIEQARTKPWFKDTLFVFVADHTASSAGKIEVDPDAYHIPAIFYAPEFVAPRRIDRLVSQIDIAPSILGALRMSYRSRFIGQDQLASEGPQRAFISNYQKVAFVRGDDIVLLGTRHDVKGFRGGLPVDAGKLDGKLLSDAIAYYQHASGWRERFAGTSSIMPGGPGD